MDILDRKVRIMKITRENIYLHLLEKQFNLIDKTIQDALLEKDWRIKWSISKDKTDEFKVYCIPLLKKVFKFNSNKAKATFDWFIFNHGLNKIS